MAQLERTPLERHLLRLLMAVSLLFCLTANSVYAKPLKPEAGVLGARQLSELERPGEALAPRNVEDNAAAAPLSPVHEEARRRWNRAKQLHHMLQPKRYVRNVGQNNGEPSTNISLPKYINELYQNLTRQRTPDGQQQQRTSTANTFRSLEVVADGESSLKKYIKVHNIMQID